jgi:hypothetical protein
MTGDQTQDIKKYLYNFFFSELCIGNAGRDFYGHPGILDDTKSFDLRGKKNHNLLQNKMLG